MTIKELEPNGVFRNFYSLTQIPRPSKKEAKVIAFMKQWGEEHGLETIIEDCGNVIMRKPSTPGMENRKGVILQAHLDMVPQKNADKVHDFENDPIETHIENGWVKANGTTLGADNGMGAAAAMAVLEATDLQHGPIEALFTIDEETGMTGANKLQPGRRHPDEHGLRNRRRTLCGLRRRGRHHRHMDSYFRGCSRWNGGLSPVCQGIERRSLRHGHQPWSRQCQQSAECHAADGG